MEFQARAIPMIFNQHGAVLRWHQRGRPWRDPEDFRVEAHVTSGIPPRCAWLRIMHIPTGMSAETNGRLSREQLMSALREHIESATDVVLLRQRHREN